MFFYIQRSWYQWMMSIDTQKSVYTNYKLWWRKMGKTISPRVDWFLFWTFEKQNILRKMKICYIHVIVLFILFNITSFPVMEWLLLPLTWTLILFGNFFFFNFFLFNTTILNSLVPVSNKRVKHTETILSTTAKMCFTVLWDQVSQGLQWD